MRTSLPLQALQESVSPEAVSAFNSCISRVGGEARSPAAKKCVFRRCISATMRDSIEYEMAKIQNEETRQRIAAGVDFTLYKIQREQEMYPPPPYPEGLPQHCEDPMRRMPDARATSWGIPDVSTGPHPNWTRPWEYASTISGYNKAEKARYDEAIFEYTIDQWDDLAVEDPSERLNEYYALHDPMLGPLGDNNPALWKSRKEYKDYVKANPPKWNSTWPIRDWPFPKNDVEYMFLFKEVKDLYEDYPLTDEQREQADRIMDNLYAFQWEFDEYVKSIGKVSQGAWTRFTPVDDAMNFILEHKVGWERPPKDPEGWVNRLPETLTDKFWNALIMEYNGKGGLTEEQVKLLARAAQEGWDTDEEEISV